MTKVEIVGILVLIYLVATAKIVHGTIVKNKWGINVNPSPCPRCKAPNPGVRVPGSLRQALWGGRVCMTCGCELDKWGHEISK